MKILLLVLLLLPFLNDAGLVNNTFITEQKKHTNVQVAYSEKLETVQAKLKTVNLNLSDLSILLVSYKAEKELEYELWKNNEIGGKTGTTSNHSDGWYMGVTKDLVTGIWVGGEDRSIHFRTSNLGEGSKTALPVFGIFMEKVYQDPNLGITMGRFPKPKVKIRKPYMCPTPWERKPKADTAAVDAALENLNEGTETPPPPPVE